MRDLFEKDHTPKTPAIKAANGKIMQVLVPRPVKQAYSYDVSDFPHAQTGGYVTIEFGKNQYTGVIWGEEEGDSKIDPSKVKPVLEFHDLPPIPAAHIKFLNWVADYYMAPRGSVLKMALPVPQAVHPEKPVIEYDLKEENIHNLKITPARQKVIDVMQCALPLTASHIAKQAGVSASVVNGLIEASILAPSDKPAASALPDLKPREHILSPEQSSAAAQMTAAVTENRYQTFLLDGVTGSGKTEIYFEVIAEAIAQGKQALLLLPEIALSHGFIKRFEKRFGFMPVTWHSHLSPAQRRKNWRAIATGKAKAVIGARSALFLPFANLGAIIVDEEHEPAYKQEEGIRYHARDMAVLRGHLGKLPVILVSATPSLETMVHAWQGKYTHIQLTSRYGAAVLPEIGAIDMRQNTPEKGCFIAPPLIEAIKDNAEKGQQSLLFLNRRGYAPLTLCQSCGHRLECPRCTAWLVEHKNGGRLHCHHCGYNCAKPKECPSCHDENSLVPCGPGVERIAEEIKMRFPDRRVLILASDTADDPENLQKKISSIQKGEVDIIVGTQIIAKGHHFPGLTLVGVVDADLGLQGGELRAAERVYQLLHQVAGRAGRENIKGTVLLQSYTPDNPIMQALISGQRDAFLKQENQMRELTAMPPYARLVGLIISGRDEHQAFELAKQIVRAAPRHEKIQILGPAQAPMARIRGKYRFRILVKSPKDIDIQKTIDAWLSTIQVPSAVKVAIDIDPQSFM